MKKTRFGKSKISKKRGPYGFFKTAKIKSGPNKGKISILGLLMRKRG